MKVEKYKKLTKGRYKVTFDTKDEYILYEEVIFKYELLLKPIVDLTKLESILNDNEYYEAYNLALSYIEYRLRSSLEVQEYLCRKNYKKETIDKIIDMLYKYHYLDDEVYVKSYINDKILLSNDGPYKIKRSLSDSLIDESIIERELSKIDENIFEEKIKKLINKRKKVNKKPMSIFILKTYEYLSNLGYDKEMIYKYLKNDNEETNEEELILKELDKLYKKYSKKYTDNELVYQVKSALFRKGYSSSIINKVMDK